MRTLFSLFKIVVFGGVIYAISIYLNAHPHAFLALKERLVQFVHENLKG